MSEFKKAVLAVVSAIPVGCVASYGQIALYVGFPRGARQVGWILNSTDRDPKIKIPWWRVVNNAGRISIKENMHSNADIQRKLLLNEGVEVNADFTLNIEAYRWQPTESELKQVKLPDKYIEKIIDGYRI